MGGFRLLGPNYKIQSVPDSVRCKCPGFRGTIDEAIETTLVNKQEKLLKLSQLPLSLQFEMKGAHLGENRMYTVTENTEEDKATWLKKTTYVKPTYTSIFSTPKIGRTYEELLAERTL